MTTVTVSDALKTALETIRDENEELSSLEQTIQFVIENPAEYVTSIDGYEETLEEPIKVTTATKARVKAIKEMNDYSDYDDVLRSKIGAPKRNTPGEEPVDVRSLS